MTTSTSPTERVGRYQLLEPIGIGPSGTVSRAKVFGVAGFERQFAVKRFHPELTATAAMAAMLSAAARAYGSLEHPRIARMSEFGVAQGSTFTAIEYVLGLDALRLIGEARLAGATLAAGGALALVSQAARAVGYAHGRGLTHLGLAPTNVIVTAEGDIKITDFGILSATLPPRPIDVARLAQRIPYLAPEQLANEATSAATDVFALGVLAYELVTGTRTFKGETPQQVAQAIMAGPPAEPALPRPIVRVLQRCLARSPFERFPDARALADALDAALRVAPVPGTRKDIGAQVKETLDRLAALNEGQMSGMVALHLGTGPIRRPDEMASDPPPRPPDLGAPAYELGRHEWRSREDQDDRRGREALERRSREDQDDRRAREALEPGAPSLLAGPPGTTLPDLPRSPMTMPGVPPPPIPVPSGLSGIPTPAPSSSSGANTLLGMGKSPPAIPAMRTPRPVAHTGATARPPAVPSAALRPGTRLGSDFAIPIEPPAARTATTESAVHPLDPSDLVPFDALAGDSDEDGDAAESPAEPSERASEPWAANASPTEPPPPAEPSPPAEPIAASDERSEARSETGERAPPERSYRPDPNSVDTKPIPPVTLELFDPIVREPPSREGTPADDEAASADDASAAGGNDGSTNGMAASDRGEPASEPADLPSPAFEQRPPGQTMLGYAAPFPMSRLNMPTPAPMPRPGDPGDPGDELSRRERRDSGAADIAAMRHEGLRTGPSPVLTPPPPAGTMPPWPPDPNQAAPDPSMQVPPSGPMLQPPMPAMHPGESPSGPHLPPHDAPAMQMPVWMPPPSQALPIPSMPAGRVPARPLRRAMWMLVGMIGAAIFGLAGWRIYLYAVEKPASPTDGSAQIAAASPDARVAAANPQAAPPTESDAAAQVAVVDAAAAPSGDAAAPAVAPPAPTPPTGPTDTLSIASTPPGARVYLDGADSGATPIKLPGSPDRHTLALLLAGHELYVAQVDGHGSFQIPLKEITPTNGPAGIKVLRCKDKDRYYVFVDGKPTGQTCPTERIGCELGPHTVEVYDLVSETRRKWDIVVKDTRLSSRVRVE